MSVRILPVWGHEPQGWLWYRETLSETLMPEEKTPETPAPEKASKTLDLEALTPAEQRTRALGRRFEAQVALALETPTFENVRRAQQLQRDIFTRADRFQARWQEVAVLDPDTYDPDLNPHTAHRRLSQRLQGKERDRQIQALAKEWGLFFLIKKGCPYCDQFAPQVKALQDRFGFDVKVISPDGGRLTLFPKVSPDNGALATLNPRGLYPSLLLAHPTTGRVVPLSWGMTSLPQLLDHFDVILKTGEVFP